MTTISWTAASSGSWTTASNWSPAQVPGVGDDAVLNGTSAYLVTVGNVTVNTITLNDAAAALSATGTLTINNGLAVSSGTLAIVSSGVVATTGINNAGTIGDNGSLTIAGVYTAADLGQIGGSGYLALTGTLMNSGGTFDGAALRGPAIGNFGTIDGGIVVGVTYDPYVFPNQVTAVLDAVTWQGVMVPGTVTVVNGLTLTGSNGSGPGTIELASANPLNTTVIDFEGNQTFDNATVMQTISGDTRTSIEADADLTLGANLSIICNASQLETTPDVITFAGSGTIQSSATIDFIGQHTPFDGSGGSFTVNDFENSGTIENSGSTGSQIYITSPIFHNLSDGLVQTAGSSIFSSIRSVAATAFTNDGMIAANAGYIDIAGALSGSGTMSVQNAATVELGSSVSNAQSIDFQGVGQLTLDQPVFVDATINGFVFGDVIDLNAAATGISYTSGDLKMQLMGGQTFDLAITGTYSFSDFIINTNSSVTTIQLPCFAEGTRIATDHGDMRVEELSVGDLVRVMLDGPVQPVLWVGHRHIDCRRHPAPHTVWPVRISAGAFGPAHPSRELFLSPDHAVYFDGALIPVKYLINHSTIVQVQARQVTYYHVELARHDVVLAEGLAVESYLDTSERANFANSGGPIMLHADFAPRRWEAAGCAPLIVTGPKLDAARAWVNAVSLTPVRPRAMLQPRAAGDGSCAR